LEQISRGADRALDLPQRAAPIVTECVQRADLRERGQFVPPESGARDEIFDGRESRTDSGLGARGSGLGDV
jgi:hypothetical protein